MIIVHYEVYVLEGRGWMLHARFPRVEREAAIAEAKELEHNLSVRVKVLRETYYTDDNAFEEAEVYISGGKIADKRPPPPGKAAPRSSTSPASSRPAPGQRATSAPIRAQNQQRAAEDVAKARQLLGRLFAIIAVALAAALLTIKLTPNAIMLLWKFGFVITVTPDSYSQLLFIMFVLTFLMVAVPLSLRYLPHKTKMPALPRPTLSWGGRDATKSAADLARERAVKKSLDKLATKALADEEALDKETFEEPIPNGELDDLPDILPVPLDGPADAGADLAEQQAWENAEPGADEIKVAVKPTRSDSLQSVVMEFLSGAVEAAKAIAPNMDSYTKFALHLYLVGAVEALCETKKQSDAAKTKLVELALESLGTRGELAHKFYDKLEEYLLEPRYLGVVQAGRDAMGDFMGGDEAGAHGGLRDVFEQWNRKSDKKAQIVTVMFTDMVGSTDMTQARGDAAAQEVVRRHNSIVRGALAQYSGKEVKHTGDGIMASFGTAAAAVEATISIQRQVSQYNQRMPGSGLSLRIGLNAGEPIQEDDDLFGATVQLAARVCAATEADQTLCTGVVKDLAANKGASVFRPMGDKVLKGFKDPVTLYEVVWM